MHNIKKEWSIYVYLNGNNELEPEMWNSMLRLINAKKSSDINIVVQLAREDINLVKLIRPNQSFVTNERWIGVRRYIIDNNQDKLIESLDNINMANYETLKDFIKWGMKTYPSKRNMVIVSGHGFMVASLSDLTKDKPYTMGLYEMCKAFNDIYIETGNIIDILFLDICYMNNIELAYELSKNKINTVKNILTYIENGPIDGIDYIELFSCLTDKVIYLTTKEILQHIITELNENLIAFEINSIIMNDIKKRSDTLGIDILTKINRKLFLNNSELNQYINEKYKEQLEPLILKVVVKYNENTKGNKLLLNIFRNDIYNINNKEAFLYYYNKLQFNINNHWANFVAQKGIDDILVDTEPIARIDVLTKENIYAFVRIFNMNLSQNQVIEIIEDIYILKNWK